MKRLKAHYLFGRTPLPQDIGDEINKELELLRKYHVRDVSDYYLLIKHLVVF